MKLKSRSQTTEVRWPVITVYFTWSKNSPSGQKRFLYHQQALPNLTQFRQNVHILGSNKFKLTYLLYYLPYRRYYGNRELAHGN